MVAYLQDSMHDSPLPPKFLMTCQLVT